jgi:hypothetical protein
LKRLSSTFWGQCNTQLLRCPISFFHQHGCFSKGNGGIECGKKGSGAEDLTPLPDNYKPVQLTDEMDQAWKDLIYDLPLPGQGLGDEEEEAETVVAE